MLAPQNVSHTSSSTVREDTAELASRALSDVGSVRSCNPPPWHTSNTTDTTQTNLDYSVDEPSGTGLTIDRNDTDYSDVIEEVLEPGSSESRPSSRRSPTTSLLTDMIKNSLASEEDEVWGSQRQRNSNLDIRIPDTPDPGVSQPHERTSLLRNRSNLVSHKHQSYTSFRDLESLEDEHESSFAQLYRNFESGRDQSIQIAHVLFNPRMWDKWKVWQVTVVKPIGYVPAIVLGLLLNILDALSYGKSFYSISERRTTDEVRFDSVPTRFRGLSGS